MKIRVSLSCVKPNGNTDYIVKAFSDSSFRYMQVFLYYYRFQSLNKDSITVSQNLEENTKILEEQNKMVAQLSQLGLAG